MYSFLKLCKSRYHCPRGKAEIQESEMNIPRADCYAFNKIKIKCSLEAGVSGKIIFCTHRLL